jgi:ABC-type multidrug transport system ATPase subunit
MTVVVALVGVGKRYGRKKAVDGVEMTLQPGQIVGLLGPNGAGKTTLLRMAAGLVRPSTGRVIYGIDPHPGAIRYFAGEQTLPPDVSIRRWRRLWGILRRRAPAGAAADATLLGTLSRGTRQRVGLEATLAMDDERLILLDEPWEGLDPDASRWLSDVLTRKRLAGASVLVSSHRIHDLAAVCDRCELLVEGRIVGNGTTLTDGLSPAERAELLFEAFDHGRSLQ